MQNKTFQQQQKYRLIEEEQLRNQKEHLHDSSYR